MDECIFCKITKGEVPSMKVYEDGQFIAFLDINPVAKGHILVIPKNHFPTLTDMSKLALANLMTVVFDVSTAMKRSLEPDGIRIQQNNGKAAGQIVSHVHFHVIPFYNDQSRAGKYANQEEMESYAKMLREAMP